MLINFSSSPTYSPLLLLNECLMTASLFPKYCLTSEINLKTATTHNMVALTCSDAAVRYRTILHVLSKMETDDKQIQTEIMDL